MSYDTYQPIYDAVRSRIHSCDVGSIVERAAMQAFDTGNLVPLAQEAIGIITHAYDRPSAVYRPTISLDGNMYCALYGEDLMAGCAGFGETMDAAMADFDQNWWKQKAPKMVAGPYKCRRCGQDFANKEASEGAAEGCRDPDCPCT